jgi:DNA-binding NtrC family response regulator
MVLIVDDDPRFLEDAANVLGPNDVWFATSAEQARSLMAAVGTSVSAALVDLDLPGENGFELIYELSRNCPDIAVIAVSGVCQEPALESAKVFGALESLRKPITSEWRDTIARACASRAA